MIFTKIFPIVSIWEVREGREKSMAEVRERIKTYLPGIGNGIEVLKSGKNQLFNFFRQAG
jgi:hypothetical protein